MDKQVTQEETTVEQPVEIKKRKRYGLLFRLIALVLIVSLFLGITSVDFSIVRYQGTDKMVAAQYLMSNTSYLQENRFQRIKSLLTEWNAYSLNLQAADMAIGKSDYDKAATFLSKCIPLCPDEEETGELYNRLGCVYMLADAPEEALEAFDSSIQLMPEEPVSYLLRGQLRYQKGDGEGAAQDAGQYVKLGGNDGEMLLVAASLCEYGGDLDGAVEALDTAIGNASEDPAMAQTIAERGRVNYLRGRTDEAVADILHARELDEGALSGVHYAIIGLDDFENEDYANSRENFLKAARLADESNAQYYEQAILCSYLLNDYAAMKEIAAEAEEKGDMTATSLLMEGIVLFSEEQYQSAEDVLSRSVDTGVIAAGVYYYRGLVKLAQGKYDLAAQDFGEAILREENKLECTFNRGICYYAMGENEKAIQDFQDVAENSDDPALAESARELIASVTDENAADASEG